MKQSRRTYLHPPAARNCSLLAAQLAAQPTTTREKASSSAGFRCISSAGTGATNKALQLIVSSSVG